MATENELSNQLRAEISVLEKEVERLKKLADQEESFRKAYTDWSKRQ